MPKPRNAIPSRRLNLHIPAIEAGKLDLYLWSDAEMRIPEGAHQRFFAARIREFFDWKSLDLSRWFEHLPSGSVLRGPAPLIDLLEEKLLCTPPKR